MKTTFTLLSAALILSACSGNSGASAQDKVAMKSETARAQRTIDYDRSLRRGVEASNIDVRILGSWTASGMAVGNRPNDRLELTFEPGRVVIGLVTLGSPKRYLGSASAGFGPSKDGQIEILLSENTGGLAQFDRFSVGLKQNIPYLITAKGEFPLARAVGA